MRSLRPFVWVAVTATVLVAATAAPAAAQQVVDAGGDNGQGGLAFVLFAVMVFLIGFSLFFMDRVRRRRAREAEEHH